ncbi:MAG: hypothetical protein ACM3MJ_09730, partial [Deltaproteobacteria bacterium]
REILSARVSRRPPSLAVTLVALAVVFALAWTFFVRSGPSASAPLVQGIQGTYTWRPVDGLGEDGTFGAVASGDAGGKASVPEDESVFSYHPPESAYDAATRTETTVGGNGGRVALATRTVGQWPPVWRVATRSPLDYQGLAAIVRTAVEDGDEAVGIKPVKDGERAVWRAAMTLDGKEVNVVVDQQTGIVTWCSDDEATFTATVDWDAPPPADTTYSVDVPAGTETETIGDTDAYEPSPAAAGRTAGYAPLVSDLAPDGYGLQSVATVADGAQVYAWTGHPTEAGPISPPRELVIGQLYTRGLSWFTLEQLGPKATHFYGAGLKDWPASSSDERLSLQQTTLQYGALKGATAYTWYQASGPSLFVSDARRAVFITGALTRQESIAFAEGLEPVPAGAAE